VDDSSELGALRVSFVELSLEVAGVARDVTEPCLELGDSATQLVDRRRLLIDVRDLVDHVQSSRADDGRVQRRLRLRHSQQPVTYA